MTIKILFMMRQLVITDLDNDSSPVQFQAFYVNQ